jgi:excisionase family DNA binding protein
MSEEFLSVEKVAARLGLHVRTVRAYVRQGRLKASRIGKQYRIAKADLDAFHQPVKPMQAVTPAKAGGSSEVTTVVQLDGIEPGIASKLTTLLIASCSSNKDDPLKQVSCRYLESSGRLRIIISGNVDSTAELLKIVQFMLAQ